MIKKKKKSPFRYLTSSEVSSSYKELKDVSVELSTESVCYISVRCLRSSVDAHLQTTEEDKSSRQKEQFAFRARFEAWWERGQPKILFQHCVFYAFSGAKREVWKQIFLSWSVTLRGCTICQRKFWANLLTCKLISIRDSLISVCFQSSCYLSALKTKNSLLLWQKCWVMTTWFCKDIQQPVGHVLLSSLQGFPAGHHWQISVSMHCRDLYWALLALVVSWNFQLRFTL